MFGKKFGGSKGGYKPGGKSGYAKREGGFGTSRGENKGPVTMHPATCTKCGERCEVPFKPNGKKPIFCSNCFVRDDGEQSEPGAFGNKRREPGAFGNERRDRGGFGERPSFNKRDDSSAQLKQINAKLDLILKAISGAAIEDDEI
jgi:CxxC-x17-CxxC domain-containing protein